MAQDRVAQTVQIVAPDGEREKHVKLLTADVEDVNLTDATLLVATIGHVQEVSLQNEIILTLYAMVLCWGRITPV